MYSISQERTSTDSNRRLVDMGFKDTGLPKYQICQVSDMPSSENGFEWVFLATHRNNGTGKVPRAPEGWAGRCWAWNPKNKAQSRRCLSVRGVWGPSPRKFSFFTFKWCTLDRFGQNLASVFYLPLIIMVRFEKFKNATWRWREHTCQWHDFTPELQLPSCYFLEHDIAIILNWLYKSKDVQAMTMNIVSL